MAAKPATASAAATATTTSGATPPIRREEDAAIDEHARWSRDLLNRADGGSSFLFPPTQVTYHPAPVLPTGPASPPSSPEPLVPQTPAQWVLQSHSVLGLCFHVDVEGAFTKPLKAYFVACSVLLVVFLSLRIQLATFFAEFLIVAASLHAAHWLQRFIFYRFQDSHLLWPFLAFAVLATLLIYDLYCFATVGGEALRHGLGVAILVYLFGFLVPEALFLVYRYYRGTHRGEARLPVHTGDGIPGARVGPPTLGVLEENYSTL